MKIKKIFTVRGKEFRVVEIEEELYPEKKWFSTRIIDEHSNKLPIFVRNKQGLKSIVEQAKTEIENFISKTDKIMKQKIKVELLLEADAEQSSDQTKAFVEELINTRSYDSRNVYSKIEIEKIKREGVDTYRVETIETEEEIEVANPFEGFKALPHKSKRKFRVERTTRDLIEYYEDFDVELSFSDEEDSNDLELIAKKIREADDFQKSNVNENQEYYPLGEDGTAELINKGGYTLDSVFEVQIAKEPSLADTLTERLRVLNSVEKEKAVLVAELKKLTNDFPIAERQIKWHDGGLKEWQSFGIGQHIEGINDEQDENVFYWVDSEEEIEVGCDLGDFKIIGE